MSSRSACDLLDPDVLGLPHDAPCAESKENYSNVLSLAMDLLQRRYEAFLMIQATDEQVRFDVVKLVATASGEKHARLKIVIAMTSVWISTIAASSRRKLLATTANP